MASGMVISVVQTLLSALQCIREIKELSFMLEYKTKLEDLERKVPTAKAFLLDAGSNYQELTEVGSDLVEKIKDAVYDADDFFDKLITNAQQLESMSENKLQRKVSRFFSDDNQLLFRFNTSREISKIREKLNAIAADQKNFGFSEKYKPVKRREETSSYIYDQTIIGREAEKEEIVSLLLSDSNSSVNTQNNVSYVSIVGMGGLGKTALAQLVYNDEKVRDAFGESLHWICVSEEFGEKQILSKFPKIEPTNTFQELQEEVLKKIRGKKYLLVLDDVWEEDHSKWIDLQRILSAGGAGSRILVTTRSIKVAKAVDQDVVVFELKGLSNENSWQLFKKIAFRPGDDHDSHLIEIGNDIVKKCANVPLSIKVTSSFLYSLDKSLWEEYRSRDLTNMRCHGDEDDIIMSTLKFSYYNLTPELKSCFSFCSLFKKDYKIEKETLISLWLAEGYLVPRSVGESMEDVGEEYFLILLQRCFFQDVERDVDGVIHSCKMHDLMHDLALEVAGKETLTLMASSTNDLKKKFRHLSVTVNAHIDALYRKECPSRRTLRTFFHLDWKVGTTVNANLLVSNCKCLRVLHLGRCHMNSFHDELGKLLHLRYLVVCDPLMKVFPRSITMLHNLQILNLSGCNNLMELPHDIQKLVNLRILDIHGCSKLKKLPEYIGKLVNLRVLKIHGCYELMRLPEDIGELVNLKILDIHDCSKLMTLPEYIGKLVNLRVLKIHGCYELIKLPEDIGELVNLKILDIHRCSILEYLKEYGLFLNYYTYKMCRIRYMPIGMNKLKNLQTLTYFVVGGDSSVRIQKGELTDLKDFVDLKGHLSIYVLTFSPSNKPEATKGANILNEARLKGLEIFCECADGQGEFHETLLEGLSPNNELKTLVMRGYQGVIFPNWGKGKVTFPSGIVKMVLAECVGLKHLSSLSKLVNLKYLHLWKMENLEYIEKDEPIDVLETFFPSLEILNIEYAQKLKGWRRDITWIEKGAKGGSGCLVDASNKCVELLPPFTRLRDLNITNCENLKYFPPCPHLKKLKLKRVNEAFHFCGQRNAYLKQNLVTNTSSSYLFCLEQLTLIAAEEFFNSSFLKGRIGNFTNLKTLFIAECDNIESLGEDDDKPWKSLTSLSSLELYNLSSLEKLPKGFQYLTSLQYLRIDNCPKLEVEGIMWKSLPSLSSLQLNSLPKLVNLSKDIQHLPSLQSLTFDECVNLESLGESISSLTSLQSLYIWKCPKLKSLPEAMRDLSSLTRLVIIKPSSELKERCQRPDGEDWPKICHIRNLQVIDRYR